MMNNPEGTETANNVETPHATVAMLRADERRLRIMAAVNAERFEDVEIEIRYALLDGLMADLAGTADRPPLPVYPRRRQ